MSAVRNVQVNFYASLRQAAGQKSLEFPISDNISVRELVSEIIKSFPDLEIQMIGEYGELYEHIHIVVNGRDIRYLDGRMEFTLSAGDQVSLFPALSGGSVKV